MPRDFYPRPEAAIVAFTANLSAKLSAAPSDYGIPPETAAEYASLQQAFAEAYATCQNAGTNASTAYTGKADARIALERMTRQLVGMFYVSPTLTDELRSALNLKPRAIRRQRRPVPDAPPILRVKATSGNVVRLELCEFTSSKRRRPRDVSGAVIKGYVGTNPPADGKAWLMMGSTSRATTQVTFAPHLPPGTLVWLTAYWFNARGESGPACTPVPTHLSHSIKTKGATTRLAA